MMKSDSEGIANKNAKRDTKSGAAAGKLPSAIVKDKQEGSETAAHDWPKKKRPEDVEAAVDPNKTKRLAVAADATPGKDLTVDDRGAIYLLHHSEFTASLRQHLMPFMTQVTCECVRIEVDRPSDERFPWLFRFLSLQRANNVLRTIMGHNDQRYCFNKALSENELMMYVRAYDAIEFEVDGEELYMAYSIAPLCAPIRRGIMGPHGVHVYEHDLPHFGFILVYRSEKTEYETECGEFVVHHKCLKIATPPERICDSLRQQNPLWNTATAI
jgi:hypothetical protein